VINMNSKAYQPQLYQVDFTKKKAGKQFAKTKRRVSWKFGFANEEAIAAGATGVECRGVEHEVCLTWSITSGKRLVTFDGKDVHYSVSPRETTFECEWQMKNGPFMKMVGHATAPINGKPVGWRQFNLFLNGLSYYDFTRVFELGPAKRGYITPAIAAIAPNKISNTERWGYHYTKEEYSLDNRIVQEQIYLEKDINKTDVDQLYDNEEYTQNTALNEIDLVDNFENKTTGEDFLDFTLEPSSTISSEAEDILSDGLLSYETKSFATGSNPTQIDPFASDYVSSTHTSSVPVNTHAHVSNEILNAYGSSRNTSKQLPLTVEYSNGNDNHQIVVDQNSIRNEKLYGNGSLGVPSLEECSTSSLCTSEEQEPWEKHTVGFENALKKLVNFDDISSAPECDQISALSMRPIESQRKTNKYKSNPLPPVSNAWCGPQPSLSQMQAVKQTSSVKTESLMQSKLSQVVQQGAYGTQQRNQGSLSPPAPGFGAGINMGYNQSCNGMGYNQSYNRNY